MSERSTPQELAVLGRHLEEWLAAQETDNEAVAAVERDREDPNRWFVRILGQDKEVWTLRLHLRQRTLYYETYLLPAPPENAEAVYAFLLRKVIDRYGVTVAIGEEDGLFLVGHLPNERLRTDGELDRVLGSIYQAVEELFVPAIRLAFASRFTDGSADEV